MGEMAEYYREQEINAFYKEGKGFPGESYEEWCVREGLREDRERVDEAMEVLDGVIRALEDGSYWIGERKKRTPVNLLTKSHAENIVGWLERRATILHEHKCLSFMAMAPSNAATHASEDYDSAFDQLNQMDAKEWLNEQPLMEALRVRAQRKLVKMKR